MPGEHPPCFRAHSALDEGLAASGELIVSEALADQSLAKRVSVHEGKRIASDGPFTDARSFWPASTSSTARAWTGQSRLPRGCRRPRVGEIEVRPAMHLKGMEM
ncbi:MAG TPA: YciI family protein [Actinomycetota bacterium]|nr:YciI family protein [Actinomycetota bacterium]